MGEGDRNADSLFGERQSSVPAPQPDRGNSRRISHHHINRWQFRHGKSPEKKSEKIYADLLHFYSSWCIIHLVRQTDTKMMKIMMKIKESIVMAKMRVLLAYSGGLDTSIIVPWLKENYDCDVVCVAGDVGQGEELEPLHEKAKK